MSTAPQYSHSRGTSLVNLNIRGHVNWTSLAFKNCRCHNNQRKKVRRGEGEDLPGETAWRDSLELEPAGKNHDASRYSRTVERSVSAGGTPGDISTRICEIRMIQQIVGLRANEIGGGEAGAC
jgi:hypothetical protein